MKSSGSRSSKVVVCVRASFSTANNLTWLERFSLRISPQEVNNELTVFLDSSE